MNDMSNAKSVAKPTREEPSKHTLLKLGLDKAEPKSAYNTAKHALYNKQPKLNLNNKDNEHVQLQVLHRYNKN